MAQRRITSRAELELAVFELFERRGFERTIDDIASAAAIGRRTVLASGFSARGAA